MVVTGAGRGLLGRAGTWRSCATSAPRGERADDSAESIAVGTTLAFPKPLIAAINGVVRRPRAGPGAGLRPALRARGRQADDELREDRADRRGRHVVAPAAHRRPRAGARPAALQPHRAGRGGAGARARAPRRARGRASLELNLVTAWITRAGRPAASATQRRRPLDRADDVDRRARELRPAGLRGGEGRADRHVTRSPRALPARASASTRSPPATSRRRATCANGGTCRAGTTACATASRWGGWGRRTTLHGAFVALIELQHMTGQTLVVDGGQTLSRPAGDAREAARAPQEEDR